jgi:hypothetical protein
MTNDSSTTGRAIRIGAGMLLTAAVLGAHFYMPSQTSALAAEAIRSLHGPGFGIVALLVFKLGRFTGGTVATYIKAGAATMLLAVLAEAAQIPGGREAQLEDLLIDALGIIGFLGCAAALDRNVLAAVGGPRTVGFALIGIPALIAAVAPTIWLTYALVMREQSMPQLLSFDQAWETTYASGDKADYDVIPAPEGWPEGSGNIARLNSAGDFGLMLHLHSYPDWSGYKAISFVAGTTGGETRRIALGFWGLKPDDGSKPGRYYTQAKIGPVPTRFCIPFEELPDATSERPFDLRYVSELLVGATKNEAGVTLYVDDFRLIREMAGCSRG